MVLIERENASLKGVLPKTYGRPELDKTKLGELIDLFSFNLGSEEAKAKDVLGRVYEYFLKKFGSTEGEFYTPPSLFTIIDYRNVFSTELFSDIKKLEKANLKKEDDISKVIDTIFRIIYVLHRPFSKTSYNDFLMSLDFSLLSNQDELQNLTNTIGEMLGTFQKGKTPRPVSRK